MLDRTQGVTKKMKPKTWTIAALRYRRLRRLLQSDFQLESISESRYSM